MFQFQDGDVLLTYGTGGLWPPRRWVLWLVYRGIRAYQRQKWGSGADYRPTHVRVWVHGRFFEMTTPVGRWTDPEDAKLDKKGWRVARYRDRQPLDAAAMEAEAETMVGSPYDRGDLLDLALSGLVGLFIGVIRLFGDRRDKYRVCSTAAAKVLRAGGAEMRITRSDLQSDAAVAADFAGDSDILPDCAVDPAYFANNPEHWEIVARG